MDFLRAEDGAVTVDWVVLTAALVGLGLAVAGTVSNGLADLSGDIRGQLQRGDIIQTSFAVPAEETPAEDGADPGDGAPGGSFAFAPSDATTYEQWIASFTAIQGGTTNYVYSDARLRGEYDLLVAQARDAMAPGGGANLTSASLRLHQAAGVARAAELRGIGLGEGSPSVETMVGEFNATFPDDAL
jgi:hypothetical protein